MPEVTETAIDPALDEKRRIAMEHGYCWEEPQKFIDDRGLHRVPSDKFFSAGPLGRLYVVPEGYEGVVLRLGDRLEWLGAKVGGRIKPGLKYMIGWGSVFSSVALVESPKRTEDLAPQNVMTQGGLVLPEIDATVNWRVTDPVKAITKASRKRDPIHNRIGYAHTTLETGLGRLRGYASGKTLIELNEDRLKERNLAFLTEDEIKAVNLKDGTNLIELTELVEDEDEQQLQDRQINYTRDQFGRLRILYCPKDLTDVGTVIESMYITSIKSPPELAAAVAEEEIAGARFRASIHDAAAAKNYANPNARFAAAIGVLNRLAESDGKFAYNIPEGITTALNNVTSAINP